MTSLRTLSLPLLTVALVATAVPASAATVQQLLSAMEVPSDAVSDAQAVGRESQAAVLERLGPIRPIHGETMAVFTSGRADDLLDMTDYEVDPGGHDPLDPNSAVYDQVLLELELVVPSSANSLTFQWYFLSREYPMFVDSEYNDRFTVMQEGAEFTGNIVFDEQDNVVDINNAFFEVTDEESLEGTGFWRPLGGELDPFDTPPPGLDMPSHEGGGTGWVTTQTPVQPGETVKLRFDVHDVGDAVYDSAVLVDGFRWSTVDIDDPVSGAQAEVRWMSPKSDLRAGGASVVLEGAHLNPEFEVYIGDVQVDASTIVGLGAGALRIEVPPSATGMVGLVDVRLVTPDSEVRLENGFLYTGSRDPALPPSLAAVRPDTADPSGGTPVRILGSSLDKVDVVRFGDQEVEFERVSSTELITVSPARRGGVVSLTVADSSAEMAGAPLPFVFKEGGVAGRRLNITVPGGCSAAGAASPISALALLPLFMLGRRRRTVLGLVVVGLLAGCHGEDTLRSLRGGALVADAVILPGNGQAIEIGVGSSVVLSGERSGAEASAGLEYEWSVVQAPDGAAPGIERAVDLVGAHDDDRRVVFTPDVVGTYLVQLSLLDRRGSRSAPDAVVVQVVPGRELSVELSWGTGGADLDLHLVRDGGAYFAEGDAFYGAPQPSWGTLSDPDDDPRYLGDHDGTGGTPPGEGIRIPSAPEGRYTVLVHYFNDRMMGETVEGSLSVSVGGEISTLPVSTRALLAGEVWRAFTVSMPDGTVTAVDELTTHDSLGGPVVNGRG